MLRPELRATRRNAERPAVASMFEVASKDKHSAIHVLFLRAVACFVRSQIDVVATDLEELRERQVPDICLLMRMRKASRRLMAQRKLNPTSGTRRCVKLTCHARIRRRFRSACNLPPRSQTPQGPS